MIRQRLGIFFLILVLQGLSSVLTNPQYGGSPVGISAVPSTGSNMMLPNTGGYTYSPPTYGGTGTIPAYIPNGMGYGGPVSMPGYGVPVSMPGYGVPSPSVQMPGYGTTGGQMPGYGTTGVQQPGYGTVQQPGYGTVQQPGYGSVQQPGYGTVGVQQPGYGTVQQPGYGTVQQPGYGTTNVQRNVHGIVTGSTGSQRGDVCGLPGNSNMVMQSSTQFARMLGGTQITNHQYCWTCAVFDRGTNTYIGGASIVDRQFLVSSASIFDGHVGNSIVVRCGILNAQSGPTQGPCGQFREVTLVRFAPNYKETDQYYRNNLAILKLSQPLDMSQSCVCKICLPGPTSNYERQKCTATGYGVNKKGGSYPGALYSITVEVINEPECNAALKQVVAGFELHNSQLCAGGQQLDVDACTGDGGSPLACIDQTGLYVLAGVVSAGFQCGIIGVPGLYTNVKIFSPFINTIVTAG